MPTLRFTNPIDVPAYRSWDFQVYPAVITLRAEDMCDIFSGYLEHHRKVYKNCPKEWPRYAESQRVANHHEILVRACGDGHDVEFDGHDVWAFSSGLMFEKRFISAHCPICESTYLPNECQIIEWSFGEDLAAEGGRRVACPSGHTLYSCMEWNS